MRTSLEAEQNLIDSLPTLPVEEVAALARQRPHEAFEIMSTAVRGGTRERAAALKALFTPAELKAMVTR